MSNTPRKKNVRKKPQSQTGAPAPAPVPALAENRQKLLKNLTIHRRIVEAGQLLLLGLTAWYVIIPSFMALSKSVLFKAVGQAIFGTATSSGIPVTIAKALLPAFMAPYAAYVILAVPVFIWGYQFAFNYINKDLFNPKAPIPAQTPAPSTQPAPAPETPAPSTQPAPTPEIPAPSAQPANKKASAAAKKAQQAARNAEQPKAAPAKQGSGRAITSAFDGQRKAGAPAKVAAANAKKRQDIPAKKPAADKAPAKRRRAGHR